MNLFCVLALSGASSVTGNMHKAVALGLEMAWMVWKFRLGLMGKRARTKGN